MRRNRAIQALAALLLAGLPASVIPAAGPPSGGPQAAPQAGQGGGPAGAPAQKKDELPPFDEVVKDWRRIDGLLPVHEKEGRYLLEIQPGQLDHDYMVSLTRETGIGQIGMLAAQVLGEVPVRFHRVGNRVHMILRNTRFTALEDPDIRRAVEKSFSDSLAASSKVESAPRQGTGAFLVDMSPFFLTDVEGVGVRLMLAFQTPYHADRENSSLGAVKGFGKNLEVQARVHFMTDKPTVLNNVPDSRSFFLTYRYSISEIPAAPDYVPRIADDRVGHFTTLFEDFSDDRRESPYVRYVTRWNLQKEEPYAALSRPREPIVYWIENSVPKKYRKALADGTLMWNKAFERIGFKDAIVVKQQPDDADWDPADVRYSTIRWFVATDAAFAIGPSRINPLTGQIYDADIGWSEGIVATRLREAEELSDPVTAISRQIRSLEGMAARGTDPRFACGLALGAVEQLGFGLELLEGRGLTAGSPDHDAYINGFLSYVQAHEVGHTLGLRHNFRSSVLIPVTDLHDVGKTRDGFVGSVMDYVPVNLAANGTKQGAYWQSTLGPYDYWAIEYAYRPIHGVKRPEDELPELRKIASRVAESGLSYGTDEDGTDPRTNVWDLGSDPVAFYGQRADLVRELWENIPGRLSREGEGYQVMRRAFHRGMNQLALAVVNVTKSVGGLHAHRDHVGDPQGRLPFQPIPPKTQRDALAFLTSRVFAPDAFAVAPDLLNRLAANRWWDFDFTVFRTPRMEYPLHDTAQAIQQATLQALFSPVRLDRLVDMELQAPPGSAFTLAEMFEGVRDAVWGEVQGGAARPINSFRRTLQREHLRKMIDLLVKPAAGTPEDAGAQARATLAGLSGRIDAVLRGAAASLDPGTRAHLEESRARAQAALSAITLRS